MAESRQAEIARLELLFAAHPEGRVFTHLAEAYRRAGELERARVLLESGLARHGDYASAHVVHGRVLLDLGRAEEAEAAFQRVLGLDPENLVALRALGDLARRAGRTGEALGYYEQLHVHDPSAPEVESVVAELRAAVGETGAETESVATATAERLEPVRADLVAEAPEFAAATATVATATAERAGAVPADLVAEAPRFTAAAAAAATAGQAVLALGHEEPGAAAAGNGAADHGRKPGPSAGASDEPEALAGPAAPGVQPAPPGPDAFGESSGVEDPAQPPSWEDPVSAPAWEEPGMPPAWDEPTRPLAPEPPEEPGEREEPPEPDELPDAEALGQAAPAVRLEPAAAARNEAAVDEAAAPAEPPSAPVADDEPGDEAAGGEVVTETLADLYLAQGLAERAAGLYRQLLAMRPGDPRLRERLERALAFRPENGHPVDPSAAPEPALSVSTAEADQDSPGVVTEAAGADPDLGGGADTDRMAEVEAVWTGRSGLGPEGVSPYTWPNEPEAPAPEAEPSIRGYFDRLMAWEPAERVASPIAAPDDEPAAASEPGDPAAAATAEPEARPADEFDALFTPAQTGDPGSATTPPAEPPALEPAAAAAEPEPTAASGALVGIADLLVGLLEYQDPSMPGGSSLVRQVATTVGRELGMADPPLRSLALASVLQGLGRLALRHRGDAEAAEPQADAGRWLEATLELLEGLDLPPGVREAIRYAQHRWDGADGVEPSGAAVPLPARILGVARDFAALLAPSAVTHSRRIGAALDELRREAGRRYDPAVVAVLVRLVGSQARAGFGLRHHVLIMHRHSATAAVLAARLRSSGYLPEPVDGVAQAWERLGGVTADALILTDEDSDGDIARFLTRLRDDARLGAIPVVVAGAGSIERRIELLNAGADVCFPADVSFSELRATLTALLRRAARPGAAVAAARMAAERARRYALQGDLVDFPLSWLLDILGFDGRTAVISISTADDEGTVHVQRGAARHAETRSRYGEAALRHMLRWRHGTFSVDLDATPAPHTIHRSLMELLVADGLAPEAGAGPPRQG